MIHLEDIHNELVRLYGENASEFEIIQSGSTFLVGRSVLEAIEISCWEEFDNLANFVVA